MINKIIPTMNINSSEIGFNAYGNWRSLYKLSFLRENHFKFVRHLSPGEDNLFNINVFGALTKITIINKKFYHYRKNPKSVMRVPEYIKRYGKPNKLGNISMMPFYRDAWKDRNWLENRKILFLKHFLLCSGTDYIYSKYNEDSLNFSKNILNVIGKEFITDEIKEKLKKISLIAYQNFEKIIHIAKMNKKINKK